ncbi:MAG TPA: hypothetical protein VIV60_26765 [Polyangiaceae bacterium]
MSQHLPPVVDGLPNISGNEELVAERVGRNRPPRHAESGLDWGRVRAGFACALHMHQPLIPAGGSDLRTASVISNLKHMMDNQHIGDNHNAPVFHWCYKRMAEFIPQLVAEGKQPRIMLEYSGVLLHGLLDMGLGDVIDALRPVTTRPEYYRCVEWLGAPFGHAVAPSTPVQDYRLHVQAFQHHFASLFGVEALDRLVGFSPSEMALPNHPDVAYHFVKTLKDCGYRWVLVQEHTIERFEDGTGVQQKHVPHLLVARNSQGDEASIIAIVKTQGSDTKLVAQMQPYYEAKGLSRTTLAGKNIPQLVTQIADGENGGVMMNEFPSKFMEAMRESSHGETPALNPTEYLDYLESLGIGAAQLPKALPLFQKRIWDRYQPGSGPERLKAVIEELKREDHRFHVDGGSWTSNISWVNGYDDVLQPMERASAKFASSVTERHISTSHPAYRNALYHLLAAETSCYRYWGEGIWTDYGRELARRALEIVEHDFG